MPSLASQTPKPQATHFDASSIDTSKLDYEQMVLEQPDDEAYPRSVLVILTTRLGLTRIDGSYFKPLKACFSLPQCVGILGGKPNFALYFVGYQEDHMIYLDPHYVQPTPQTHPSNLEGKQLKEFRETYVSQRAAKKISMDSLDPCVGIGFLIQNGRDLKAVLEAFDYPLASQAKVSAYLYS